MIDTMMVHSVSSSTKNNAARFSHNSIQGHFHSNFEISYAADTNQIRWAMTVGCLMNPDGVAARYGSGIILKRPIKGKKICNNINYQIKGKSTRFDVYI